MMGKFHIRVLLSVFCLTLVAVLFTGCGLLGGTDALEPPEGFHQLVSLPLPGGMRVTIYRGAASPEAAMSIFTNIALQEGWRLREREEDVRSMDVVGFSLSVVPVEKEDGMQLLAFTGAADAALVVSVIGPAERIAEYYDSLPAGDPGIAMPPAPVSADDDKSAGEHLGEDVLDIRAAVTLVERFSLFEFMTGGTLIRYEYVGVEQLDGSDVHKVRFFLDQTELDFWLDMDGNTVDVLVDGEVPPGDDVAAEGDRFLQSIMIYLEYGLQSWTADDLDEEFIAEETSERQQFGPTSAVVVRRVVKYPWADETLEIDYVDLDGVLLLTRFVVADDEVFAVTEFELR